MHAPVTHSSQYGEHTVILEHFQNRLGNFLDIGAHDGRIFSNTSQLHDAGWSGVALEPSPSVFPYLMKNYEASDRMQLVNAALGPVSRLGQWWDNNGDCLGTFSTTNKDKFSKLGQPFKALWLPVITWSQLLEQLPGPYHLINIDVEGWNWEVLQHAPLAQLGVEMLCIEIDPSEMLSPMRNLLAKAGLVNHKIVVGNLLAWRN